MRLEQAVAGAKAAGEQLERVVQLLGERRPPTTGVSRGRSWPERDRERQQQPGELSSEG